jgi:hypothetical protein
MVLADTNHMTEGPYPEVPRVAGPVTGITSARALGEERRRRQAKARPEGPPSDPGPDGDPEAPVDLPHEEPNPLIEALDRLRATGEERHAEDAIVRLLRARRLYHDEGHLGAIYDSLGSDADQGPASD